MIAVLVLCTSLLACKDKPASKKVDDKPQTQTVTRPRPLDTAEIEGAGVVPAVGLGPKIVINKQELTLDGEPILTVAGDAPFVRRDLDALTQRLEMKVKGDEPIALMIDSTMPFYRFAVIFDALRKAGFRRLALLTGTGAKMIPLDLLDTAEANKGGLRPIVTIKRGQLTLWSGSGEEGTRTEPKLSYDLTTSPSFKPLTRALAEIVQRRWPDGKRPDEDRVIFIQLDGGTTADVMLATLAAVRADGTLVLFPSIFLSGGA